MGFASVGALTGSCVKLAGGTFGQWSGLADNVNDVRDSKQRKGKRRAGNGLGIDHLARNPKQKCDEPESTH